MSSATTSAILEVTPQHGPLMLPEQYDGFPGKYKGFLMQYAIIFACAPAHIFRYKDKIHKELTLLTGKALAWGTTMFNPTLLNQSYTSFKQKFPEVFNHLELRKNAEKRLLTLKQGKQTAADFAITFCILDAESEWNESMLKTVFCQGLNEALQSELACRDDSLMPDQFIQLAICIDNLIRA